MENSKILNPSAGPKKAQKESSDEKKSYSSEKRRVETLRGEFTMFPTFQTNPFVKQDRSLRLSGDEDPETQPLNPQADAHPQKSMALRLFRSEKNVERVRRFFTYLLVLFGTVGFTVAIVTQIQQGGSNVPTTGENDDGGIIEVTGQVTGITSKSVTLSSEDDYLAAYSHYGCSYNDDDVVYLQNDYCAGDSVCNAYESRASAGNPASLLALDQCGQACATEKSWMVPCMWDTVAHMDSYCRTSGYTATLEKFEELTSVNEEPQSQYFEVTLNNTGQTTSPCNLHAFCLMCVDLDSANTDGLNPYCKAYAQYYNSMDVSADNHFFADAESFWCTDEVLDSIREGQFNQKYIHKGAAN